MWTALFIRFLRRLIRKGHLVVSVGDSGEISFGDGDGPKVTVRIKDQPTARRLMRDPELALGEAYMDGALSIESDDVQGLLGVAMRNRTHAEGLPATARVLAAVRHVRRRLDQSNPEAGARRNVAHHYDLTPAIYDLFLDVVRQYSCAYFANDTMTLEVAQNAKKTHIANKLLITPGMRVLDIGCGWGGLALTLASDYGAQVTAITLSQEQLTIARERAQAAGLAGQVSFKLIDYRAMTGQFDRIVSVGMFEYVGAPPDATNPWIAKYIFPGGYVPSLSEMAEAIEDAELRIGDRGY